LLEDTAIAADELVGGLLEGCRKGRLGVVRIDSR
jgi:hypothetical protein